MQKITVIALVCGLWLGPLTANAGAIISGSLGGGAVVKGGGSHPINIMIAPGYGLGEMIRLELGIVGDVANREGGGFDLGLRPMLVIDPPLIPVFVRVIAGVVNLLGDGPDDPQIVYGGALGIGGSLFGFGMFLEAGILPVGGASKIILEGRAGAYIAFD